MLELPHGLDVHRCECAAASAGGFDGGARVSELRLALGDQAVPHDAAAWHLAAPAVFSRRLGQYARGRRTDLQHQEVTGPDRRAGRGPGAVSQVALTRPLGTLARCGTTTSPA